MRSTDSTASSRRLSGRVVEHALFSVTTDVLMKCSQSFRANGSDQEKIGRREGESPEERNSDEIEDSDIR